MSPVTLLDTGSLVALLYRRDQYHDWAVEQIREIRAPLLTCEAVVAEACFLTQRMLGSSKAVYDLIETGAVEIDFRLSDEISNIKTLALRYESVPMSFADACLVRMAEIHPNSTIFTTDSDFAIYRRNKTETIHLITPQF